MKNLNHLSEQLLLAIKNEAPYENYLKVLADIPMGEIKNQLISDQYKNAFWINIYNSFFQILRKYKHLEQSKIYTAKDLVIAGRQISLDDIEHGILRRFRFKYSLGYFPNLFIATQIKKWAVTKVDYRIHFALNCGAKSCPPIAFYSVAKLDEQLDLSSQGFIEEETIIDEQQKTLHISRLFLWFLNDFKGKKGVRNILKKYLGRDFTGYKLKYNHYSWEEQLDNYAENRFDQYP